MENEVKSGIYIQFAGPGSANILNVTPEGAVSPFQLFVAAKYLELMGTNTLEENMRVQSQVQKMLAR